VDDPLYREYFDALRDNKLVAQSCARCGHTQWPPRYFCFRCHGTDLGWKEVNDSGTVYTYNISYRAFHPWFTGHVPYTVLVVQLEHGIRMLGPYTADDAEDIECGISVKAHYCKLSDAVTLLGWRKV
jgi:uncharacterized protein